jgi:TorA maturation chaperone TorD
MRVIQHLGLRWNEQALPPDHLGAACDVLVCAIAREESLLIRELRKRYFEPWCAAAIERLAGKGDALVRLPEAFAADLRAIEPGNPT